MTFPQYKEKPWWRCDDCGKYRRMDQMTRGENPSMDLNGNVDLNEYQICKPGLGCRREEQPSTR